MRWLGLLIMCAVLSLGMARADDTLPLTLDADDRLILTLLSQSASRSQGDCEALSGRREYRAMERQVEARLTAKYGKAATLAQAIQALTASGK